MHSMSGLNLALEWHLWCLHVHLSNQDGIVSSGGLFSNVLAFMSKNHLDLFEDIMSFLRAHTVLLCCLILRAWMCC